MQVRAFSKINLLLEVLERRADNYHNLRSVMQSLSLHDTITITTQESNNDESPCVTVTCDNPGLFTDERNLVTRAALYIKEAFDTGRQNINLHIEKRIPVAAGLGGGSSDCAATLVGLNQIFNLSLTVDALRKIGLRFGADVPFCITGGTFLAEGVGEKLTELPAHPPCWIVLACLDIPVSTAEIFKKCVPSNAGDCINRLIQSEFFYDLNRITSMFKNDLMQVTVVMHPQIAELIEDMKQLGAINAAMSGSGPSVFGYFTCEQSAQAAKHTLKKTINNVYITQPERMRLP